MWRAAVLTLLFVACDSSTITGPTPPPSPPPAPPPAHNPGAPFSWGNARGILLFAGTQASEEELRTLDRRLKGRWVGKRVTYNVCSETTGWKHPQIPWPAGPPAFSRENLDNLRRFLKVTADRGSQVKLNIFCTLRDNHEWMWENAGRYAQTIAKIAKDYAHVTLSIANEYYHPASALRDGSRLRELRDTVQAAGFQGLIGTDDNIGCAGCSVAYNPALRALGFLPEFHPYRGPHPTRKALRRIAATNGLPTIISEPVAYSSWRGGRCCISDRAEIERHLCNIEAEGMVAFFHSTDGLQWPTQVSHFEWIPEVRCEG